MGNSNKIQKWATSASLMLVAESWRWWIFNVESPSLTQPPTFQIGRQFLSIYIAYRICVTNIDDAEFKLNILLETSYFDLVTLNSTALLFNQNQAFFLVITQNAFSLIFLYFWSDSKCISVYCSWILLQKRSKRSILRSWSRFFISWIVIRANHNEINTPKLFNFTFHYYIYEYQYLVNFDEFGIKRSISQLFYK